MPRRSVGKVALVGAGPGDPGLLTLRGREALSQAQVVVYDRLLSPGILRFASKGATLVAAEALGAHGDARQRGIDRVLIEEALRGRHVVRLKNGDPFLLGRGMEEVEALEAYGIPCEVVPGVTSAIAGPGLAGIPVTHRGQSSVVTIATGHEAAGCDSIPWEQIARIGGTIVVLMCTERIGMIARRLRDGGLDGSTPVAVVSRASLPSQEVRTATLATVAEVLRREAVRTPTLLIVGKVAAFALRKKRPRRSRSVAKGLLR